MPRSIIGWRVLLKRMRRSSLSSETMRRKELPIISYVSSAIWSFPEAATLAFNHLVESCAGNTTRVLIVISNVKNGEGSVHTYGIGLCMASWSSLRAASFASNHKGEFCIRKTSIFLIRKN